jgi:fibronectin-binding autotransporter adhesin
MSKGFNFPQIENRDQNVMRKRSHLLNAIDPFDKIRLVLAVSRGRCTFERFFNVRKLCCKRKPLDFHELFSGAKAIALIQEYWRYFNVKWLPALGVATWLYIAATPPLGAQVFFWIGPDGGLWDDPNNWSSGAVPGTSGHSLRPYVFIREFSGDGTGDGIISLDGDTFTIGGLWISVENGLLLKNGTLALDHPDNAFLIISSNGFERSNGFEAKENLTIDLSENGGTPIPVFVAEGQPFTMKGVFSGDGGLEAVGPGRIILNNINAHRGITSVVEGTLEISANGGIQGDASVNAAGHLVNSGTIGGAVTVTGGKLTVNGGTIGGAVAVSGGTMIVVGKLDQAGGDFWLMNGGNLTLEADHVGIGVATINGLLRPTTTGTRHSFAANTITGDENGLIDLSLVDAHGGQGLAIVGNLTGNIRILLPSDLLSGALVTNEPVVSWDGELPAALPGRSVPLVLDFVATDSGVLVGNKIPILQTRSTELSGVSTAGLPTTGGLVSAFLVFDEPTNTFNLLTSANPALGGITGSFAMVESLIGSEVNRRTGSVGGLPILDTECVRGGWLRKVGGSARGTAMIESITSGGGAVRLPSETMLKYVGLRSGFDFGCYRSARGWDIAVGINAGFSHGSTYQDVFNLIVDPVSGIANRGALSSETRGSFRQVYMGAYLAAARGDWLGELQIRRESSRHTLTNIALGGVALPLTDQRFTSTGTTFSGSLFHRISLPNGLSLTPSAGFSISRVSEGALEFDADTNPAVGLPVPAGRLDVRGHTKHSAYIGADLSAVGFPKDGTGTTSRFVGLKLYGDFSPARQTGFTQNSATGLEHSSVDLFTRQRERYGELSFGISHSRPMRNDNDLGHLHLSLRGKIRLDRPRQAYSITAEARLRF